jgi:MFS family permease
MRSEGSIFLRFIPFWLFLLFFKFAGALHYTLLAPYGERLMPLWIVGLLIGGESFLQMTLDIPAGFLLDRVGYKKLIVYTTGFFMLSALSIALGLTMLTYLLTIFFSIFGWLFYTPGTAAYILSHATEEESGRFFSLKDIANSVGVVCASIALPFTLLIAPQYAGLGLLVLQILALMSLYFSPPDNHRLPKIEVQTSHIKRHLRHHTVQKLWLAIRKLNPASGMLLLLTFVSSFFYAAVWFVVPVVIANTHTGSLLLSIGLGIFDFAIVVLGYGIGVLADRYEKRRFVFFGLLLFALCGMAVGFNFGILFIFFGFFATTGDEMAGISLWSWLHHLDNNHDSDGAVSGAVTFFDDFGYALGPIASGILYTVVGPQWTIALGAVPILIVWLVYFAFVHSNIPSEAKYRHASKKPYHSRHKS